MSSIREQIIQAMVAALNENLPANIPTAKRAVLVSDDSSAMPLISVYPASDVAERLHNGAISKRRLSVKVECHAIGLVGDEAADSLVDDLVCHVVARLSGNKLGGLVNTLDELKTDFVIEPADYAYCAALIEFSVSYSTIHNDLTKR